MNRASLPAAILFLLVSFYHKGFSQNTFLSGHLSGIEDGKYIYLTAYPFGETTIYRDSAMIKKGMFSLQLSIPDGDGSLYFISAAPMQIVDQAPADRIKFTHSWQLIYLQKGHATVNGDVRYLDSAMYAGDPYMQEENEYFARQRTNREWERFKNRLNEAYARGENMHNGRPLKDDSASREMFRGFSKRTQIAEDWVQTHPNSPYSAAVVYKDIGKLFDEKQQEKARFFHLLTPAARNNKVGKFMADWLH